MNHLRTEERIPDRSFTEPVGGAMTAPGPTEAEPRTWPLIIAASTLPTRSVVVRGKQCWQTSPGGLVSALVPVAQRRGGAWIGWTGTPGVTVDPFVHDNIYNLPVSISTGESDSYYEGFCNRTLWPLYHDAVSEPEYHRHWWFAYLAVNVRFADMLARAAAPGATVWIHDYHLQLVPALLRNRRPDLCIGFFLHIPFPPEELFARLPWRTAVLKGLMGADVIGFQTRAGARNFLQVARRYTDAVRQGNHLNVGDREVQVDAFPISIDFEQFDSRARDETVRRRAEELRQRLGGGRRIILGVDRLDYTKGIDVRLKAYRELLAERKASIRDSVLVQVAVPSRARIVEYKEMRSRIEELVGQINGEFGEVGTAAVHYLRRNLPFDELIAMYRAADVMLVTPLCDGMNLVAKEYVATRHDNTGAIILSEFVGAAAELRRAILVNPHDVDGLVDALQDALNMSRSEQSRRMQALRRVVRRQTVHVWASSFFEALQSCGSSVRPAAPESS